MRLYAKTPEAFKTEYQQLKIDYSGQPDLVNYLDQYKYPVRELFVEAWTSQHKHFGITVTSRIEGSHSCLKSLLGTSKSDLFGVIKIAGILHKEQYDKIPDELAKSRDSIPHDINAKYHKWMDPDLNTKVIPHALRLLKQQYELTLQSTFKPNECRCTLRPYDS